MRKGVGILICVGSLVAALSTVRAGEEKAQTTEGLLAATCPAADRYDGSFSAAVSFNTLLEEPKRKVKRAYQCKSGPVAAYLYEYGDAAMARTQAAFLGAKLWGGPGPSSMHRDELLFAGGTLVILSGPGQQELVDALVKKRSFAPYREPGASGRGDGLQPAHSGEGTLTGAEDAAGVARAFAAAVQCNGNDDPLRDWCAVTKIAAGTFSAPKDAQAYPGMSIALTRGASIREALGKRLAFSVLVLSAQQAFLQELTPENDEERREIISGLKAVVTAFRKSGPVGPLGAGLTSEIATLRSKLALRGHPIKDEGKRATYMAQAASELYLVDSPTRAYVVLERVPSGLFISVFPAPAPH